MMTVNEVSKLTGVSIRTLQSVSYTHLVQMSVRSQPLFLLQKAETLPVLPSEMPSLFIEIP